MADSAKQSEETPTVFDTGQEYLGSVYAKALLGVTEKAGNTDVVLEEFDSFVGDILSRLPRLEATLASPRVPHEVKESTLNSAFEGKMAGQLLNFLKVVSRHGRFDCIRAIHRSVKQQFNELRGRLEVHVTTAVELDAKLADQIAGKLKDALKKDVAVTPSVDPELIGGIIIRVGDTVFDGSVANRLVQVRERTLDKAAQQIRASLERFVLAE